ncbi:MAG: aminotransferase class I/II-fold pyridoxal phosphate-dependent enzyme, partial [Candidatus Omnitrophica bacterium]|nr:aminotransferase class I/II-fold pyridoxal phosphate-dependent enzyme [Candidatus Omnitrophota bacterium]
TAKDYVDSIKLLKQYPNVFVTRTFSKMYGLAGLRIGYGIGNAMVIDWLNRVREPFNVNSIAQAAALACLEDDAYYKKVATTLQKEREYFYRQFERLGLAYIKSDANFILVKLENDAQKYAGKLLEKGMIVRDMSIWGLENYLRVTIGRRLENQKFIKTLEEIL